MVQRRARRAGAAFFTAADFLAGAFCAQSTGPRSAEVKARTARNGFKGGDWRPWRDLEKFVSEQLRDQCVELIALPRHRLTRHHRRRGHARAVGTIPFGVLRNSGSSSRRRRRARPWLTADEMSRSRSAARPT